MWVFNKKENLGVNLSRFDTIYALDDNSIMVSRIECDEDYREVRARIKAFNNKADAEKYIAELVEKLNVEKN